MRRTFILWIMAVALSGGFGATAQAPAARLLEWGTYRGANINHQFTDTDAAVLRSWGANLVRVNFHQLNLMQKQPPFAINNTAVASLDNILDVCERNGLRAIIDPHTTPGTASSTTTVPSDLLWTDFAYHEHLIRLWKFLAARYKDRGEVIAGYDLLNEPSPPRGADTVGTPADWNLLVRKLAGAIRESDRVHTLVVEFPIFANVPGGLPPVDDMVNYLEPIDDENTVYSVHWYAPGEFTHQGVDQRPLGLPYPGMYRGVPWDLSLHEQLLRPVAVFQHRHNVPIYLGEFAAARWSGEHGDRWMSDIARIAERWGWSWTYHSFRIASVWDVEKSNTIREDGTRYETTPRLILMKQLFAANETPLMRAASGGMVQSASYLQGALVPYQFFSLFGEHLGPAEGVGTMLDGSGEISRSLAGVEVRIAGEPAPLVYVSAGQINGVVPMSVAGLTQAAVEVRRGTRTATFGIDVGSLFPGLFTAAATGIGQAAAFNQDGTLNSPVRPETRGRVVVIYASGAGLLDIGARSGAIASLPLPKPLAAVAVDVGGEMAAVEYAGCAVGMPMGLVQINFRIPESAPVGDAIPVTVTFGGIRSQAGVTIALR